MRPRTAVILGLAMGALLLGSFALAVRALRSAREDFDVSFARWAFETARPTPVVTTGTTCVYDAGRWREAKVRSTYVGDLVRTEVAWSGERVTLLDDGRRLWRLDATRKGAVALGPSERRLDWSLLRRNYEVRQEYTPPLPGRSTETIALVSRRSGRRAMLIAFDEGTGVVIRRLSYDADGHLVADTEVTRLEDRWSSPAPAIGIPPGWARRDDQATPPPTTPERFAAEAGFEPRPPTDVPRGYRLVGLYQRACPRGRPYAELRYLDGLRTLSVFEHVPRGRHGRGGRGGCACGQGPPDARPVLIDQGQAKTLRQRRPDLMVVARGDLTAAELLALIRSVP